MNLSRYQPFTFVHAAASDRVVAWSPAVDVHEEADRFVVRADLPGVESKDIDVTAENGVLTIRGQRVFEKQDENRSYERLERVEGEFLRRFTLPKNAQADQIKAKHVNGVLEIAIPKQARVEPKRISIDTH